MEFPSAQRLKSGNSRSLIFGVLLFWPTLRAVVSPGRDTSQYSVRPGEPLLAGYFGSGLKQKISHECEGKFHFYICIGMFLSCWWKGKYSGTYSLGFSEESYQGEQNFLSCCGSLSIMNTMTTMQDTKLPFQQSIAELCSVDNFPNVVHHFFQSVLLASKGE